MVVVFLRSEEFGEEEFHYASAGEALDGIARLAEQSSAQFAKDGIKREIALQIGELMTRENHERQACR